MKYADEIALLYHAFASRRGIIVEVLGNRETARQRLYAARRETGDPDLDLLQFRLSPSAADQIWIVKGGAPSPQTDAEESIQQDDSSSHSDGLA